MSNILEANKTIKVLVVEDSSFARLILADIIREQSHLEMIGTAENGLEAVEKVKEIQPDVVLMDITMKDYDGLYAIRRIMEENPLPIVVLSALGNTDADIVFESLKAGAVTFLNKPQSKVGGRLRNIGSQLITSIEEAAGLQKKKLVIPESNKNMHPHTFPASLSYEILVIGASTGGPRTIEDFIQSLPGNFPLPIVIGQHMPETFIPTFAKRLNSLVNLRVKVAVEGETLLPGTIYIASGEGNMYIASHGKRGKVAYTQEQFKEFNNPSINAIFESAADIYGQNSIAVILTGMGRDGATGMKKIHQKGGLTIAQDEESSVIFGMPKAAIGMNCVDEVLALKEIPGYVVSSI